MKKGIPLFIKLAYNIILLVLIGGANGLIYWQRLAVRHALPELRLL
jgi:hypothetical protein